MNVVAAALDVRGTVLDVPISWSTLTPQLLAVDASGEVRALAPGVGTLRPTAGSVSSQISLTLQNPPAARIDLEVRVPPGRGISTSPWFPGSLRWSRATQ